MKQFRKDLKIAIENEKKVASFFEKQGCIVHEINDDKEYDLLIEKDGDMKKYELKTDYFVTKEHDSGNVFVEYECRGKASGISTSTADWWIFYLIHLKELWFIKTEDLKQVISEFHFNTTHTAGDEGSRTKGYLVGRNDKLIRPNFTVVNVR